MIVTGTNAAIADEPPRKARKSVDSLRLAAWALPNGAPSLPMTTCQMDVTSHRQVKAWTQKKLGRDDVTPILRGLHELVAHFVPETAFITVRPEGRNGPGRLTLSFAGHRKGDDDLRRRLRPALLRWLAINFETEPGDQRMRLADAMLADTVWEETNVATGWAWNAGRTCPEPVGGRQLWDAIVAHAVAALAGKPVSFRRGEERWLVPTRPGPGGSTFNGVQLVAYPPKRGPEGGYYSEVVTLTTATFPEREGIHLLMQVSMRSWGSLIGTRSENQRTIDVFMPSHGGAEGNYANWRHSSFACVRRGFERAEGEAKGTERWVWRHDQSQKVMKVCLGVE